MKSCADEEARATGLACKEITYLNYASSITTRPPNRSRQRVLEGAQKAVEEWRRRRLDVGSSSSTHPVGSVANVSLLAEIRPGVLDFGALGIGERAPTGPKTEASSRDLNDRCHRGSLGDVAASISLITQRSSVQIRPPHPWATRVSGRKSR